MEASISLKGKVLKYSVQNKSWPKRCDNLTQKAVPQSVLFHEDGELTGEELKKKAMAYLS